MLGAAARTTARESAASAAKAAKLPAPRASATVGVRRNAWGVMAVALGAWEAAAFVAGRPTVTARCRQIRRHPAGKALLAAWLLGLGWHLLFSKEET